MYSLVLLVFLRNEQPSNYQQVTISLSNLYKVIDKNNVVFCKINIFHFYAEKASVILEEEYYVNKISFVLKFIIIFLYFFFNFT